MTHTHYLIELHRIDPDDSRPPLGTNTIQKDGSTRFDPKLDSDGKPTFGAKKYSEKVIVYYCPECGEKKEKPWK